MKTFLVFLFVIFFNDQISSQVENDSIIYWSKDIKLNWSDFKGKVVDPSRNQVASSHIGIRASGYLLEGIPNYKIIAYFTRYKSWSKDTSNSVLNHEQLHFDICELYARKIRKALHESQENEDNSLSDKQEMIYSYIEKFKKSTALYDKETAHGLNELDQKVWDEKIINQLSDLSDYEVDYLNYLE